MSDITTTFQLSGLHCESCKKITEKRIQKIEGVTQAKTDLETGALSITADREISKQEVTQVLEGTDYQVN